MVFPWVGAIGKSIFSFTDFKKVIANRKGDSLLYSWICFLPNCFVQLLGLSSISYILSDCVSLLMSRSFEFLHECATANKINNIIDTLNFVLQYTDQEEHVWGGKCTYNRNHKEPIKFTIQCQDLNQSMVWGLPLYTGCAKIQSWIFLSVFKMS